MYFKEEHMVGRNKPLSKYRIIITILGMIFILGGLTTSFAQDIKPELFSQLKYRFIGPKGNRFAAVTGVPSNPYICYAGSASGGIFKSEDDGITWEPIFDDQPVSSVSALAVAPSDPNIVWAGTGETFIRNVISVGNGVYKTTDAGKTWSHMGLPDSGRIPRIIVDPRDPDIVFVAVLGHCHGPQKDKGVYRTLDGGKTWKKVLFLDEVTGCSDMVMDPNNPRIILAGMWAFQMTHWSRNGYSGPNGGLYLSRDGGTTWKKITKGLPKTPTGKIAVAMSAHNSNRMYALIENLEGTLWRSDNGGDSWRLVNKDHIIQNRPVYYTRMAVAPDSCDEVYFVAGQISVSTDGGLTHKRLRLKGGDNHDMWINPLNANRMMVANDQHISLSLNRGKTWNGVTLPNAQMYHVAVDNQIPYYVYGNKQDGPTYCGPSNSRQRGGVIPSTVWHNVGGGEAGFTVPDPVDSNIIWSGEYQGQLTRWDRRTGHARGVSVWKEDFIAHPPKDLKYRFQWTMPISISPHDHNQIYVGSQYVHTTIDGGQSWKIISPDLTTSAPDMMERNFDLIAESADPLMSCTLFAIAESPLEKGQIWAGTNDGLLHVTRDSGKNWINVTANIPNFPPRGKITNIEPSRFDAGTCYFSADLHEMNHWDTYVYKTQNYGKTWKKISSNIPKGYLSFAHCIREDPIRKGLLYLGTENMLYVSFNDGDSWAPLQKGLPHAPVHWLVIQEHFNDLVVGTFGRGFYIMDDISPLQQLTSQVLQSDVHLFDLRPAYRFLSVSSYDQETNDMCNGQSPDYGASINYYLKSIPKGDVTIQISNDKGETVRTLKGAKNVGINRIMWDLKNEILRTVKLRTPPLNEHFLPYGPEGWRPLVQYGGRPLQVLCPPGTYTVKVSVDGKELEQKLLVKKDPNSDGTEQDILTQTKLLMRLRKNQDDLIKMINSFEWIRKQMYDLRSILQKDQGQEDVLVQIEELDRNILDVEGNFFALSCTGSADTLRFPAGIYTKFPSLAGEISRADFPPTDSQIELQKKLEADLKGYQNKYNEIITQDLAEFNDLLKSKNVSHIVNLEK